jgi:DNA-binding transcriptional LysR family regulator
VIKLSDGEGTAGLRMNVSLDRVLRFVAVAEHMSFTRAAEALRIDQPWLSRQIMQLEEQLGVTLFDRSKSRITLTADGEELLRVARPAARLVQDIRRTAEEISRRSRSVLRIGVSYPTFLLPSRTRLLDGFAEIRPGVRVELSACETSDEVLDHLARDEIDFGLVIGPFPDADFDVQVIEPIRATLAIPQEDPLSAQPSVTLAELSGRGVAVGLRDLTSYRFRNAYGWIEKVGATAVPVLEGRRFAGAVAERERLIMLCYSEAEALPVGFVHRPIRGPAPTINLSLARHRRTLPSAAERFWRLAGEMAAERHAAE